MINKMLTTIIVFCALILLSSCNNTSVGPNMIDISGTYAYKEIDSSGSILDSGTLKLTQIDSALTGEIHTQTESAMIRGQINYAGTIQFSEDPEKIISPVWIGLWQGDIIQGYVVISTGGPPIPQSKQKFLATREIIY
jgi:hypothetical protein